MPCPMGPVGPCAGLDGLAFDIEAIPFVKQGRAALSGELKRCRQAAIRLIQDHDETVIAGLGAAGTTDNLRRHGSPLGAGSRPGCR
ncbi:hypothetical protein [Modicisalibacter luteus]|uniref:hypothetical protein n=1 Tax=Modicisalibacter luteus TaxID=453962 RepID=UPI00037829CA|nr:hypothetical protein [Halomonas lutea]GHB12800.1 hypothetical protein GCM10007159_38860 [Halomonas lutea]